MSEPLGVQRVEFYVVEVAAPCVVDRHRATIRHGPARRTRAGNHQLKTRHVLGRLTIVTMTDVVGMSVPIRERKIALLRACWAYFDDVASRVSPELRKGPRGGGRDRDRVVRHANGSEIDDFAKKVGVITPLDAWQDPVELRAYRDAFCEAIREHNARGASARTWTVQFLIRRCAYHMLDHAWEMEDKDLSSET
jgi:hypothetical protein